MLADKPYSSRTNRVYLRRSGIKATIAQPRDQAAHRKTTGPRGGRPPAFEPEADKQRHAVATRCDKLAVHYQAIIHIAANTIWLRHI
nr:hypothetical protein GCM10020241_11990 [Streptoalloteichus tenebrarius]